MQAERLPKFYRTMYSRVCLALFAALFPFMAILQRVCEISSTSAGRIEIFIIAITLGLLIAVSAPIWQISGNRGVADLKHGVWYYALFLCLVPAVNTVAYFDVINYDTKVCVNLLIVGVGVGLVLATVIQTWLPNKDFDEQSI